MYRLFIIAVACAALVACKKSKKDKCEKTWDRLASMAREMAKAFGGSDADMPTAEDKKQFMDMCMQLSDDALDCVDNPMRSGCEEVLKEAGKAMATPTKAVAIEWTKAPLKNQRGSVMAPGGWTHDDFAGDMWTPEGGKLGFASFEVRELCAGDCAAQPAAEWAKRVEENDVKDLKANADAKVVRDDKLGDTGRIVITEEEFGGSTMTKVNVYKWKDGGELYMGCRAELGIELSKNIDEFVKACSDMEIASFTASHEDAGGGGDLLEQLDDDAPETPDAGAK